MWIPLSSQTYVSTGRLVMKKSKIGTHIECEYYYTFLSLIQSVIILKNYLYFFWKYRFKLDIYSTYLDLSNVNIIKLSDMQVPVGWENVITQIPPLMQSVIILKNHLILIDQMWTSSSSQTLSDMQVPLGWGNVITHSSL